MTISQFNAKLSKLNQNLMASTTREEHAVADRAINNLVDGYVGKNKNNNLADANAIALAMSG